MTRVSLVEEMDQHTPPLKVPCVVVDVKNAGQGSLEFRFGTVVRHYSAVSLETGERIAEFYLFPDQAGEYPLFLENELGVPIVIMGLPPLGIALSLTHPRLDPLTSPIRELGIFLEHGGSDYAVVLGGSTDCPVTCRWSIASQFAPPVAPVKTANWWLDFPTGGVAVQVATKWGPHVLSFISRAPVGDIQHQMFDLLEKNPCGFYGDMAE